MNKFVIMIATVTVAATLAIGGVSSCSKINPGYAGVVYSPAGGIKGETLSQGYNFVNPFYSVTKYTVATEQVFMSSDSREGSKTNDSFMVGTSDGKMVSVDLAYSYRYDVDKLPKLFTRFRGRSGEDINNTYIRAKIKTFTSEVTSQYNVLDIYGSKRSQLNSDLFKHLRDKFAKDGIIIESANFIKIQLDVATARMIQKRVDAQQELETQRVEAQKAKIEAEKNAIIEQGKAKVAKIKADANANVTLTGARAEAEANRLKVRAITPQLIEYMKAEKWNGELPTVTGGSTPMLNLGGK